MVDKIIKNNNFAFDWKRIFVLFLKFIITLIYSLFVSTYFLLLNSLLISVGLASENEIVLYISIAMLFFVSVISYLFFRKIALKKIKLNSSFFHICAIVFSYIIVYQSALLYSDYVTRNINWALTTTSVYLQFLLARILNNIIDIYLLLIIFVSICKKVIKFILSLRNKKNKDVDIQKNIIENKTNTINNIEIDKLIDEKLKIMLDEKFDNTIRDKQEKNDTKNSSFNEIDLIDTSVLESDFN